MKKCLRHLTYCIMFLFLTSAIPLQVTAKGGSPLPADTIAAAAAEDAPSEASIGEASEASTGEAC